MRIKMMKIRGTWEMGRFRHDLLLLAVNFINGLTMAALFGLCWFGFYSDKIFIPFYFYGDLYIIALFGVIYFLLCGTYDAFEISLQRISETFYSQVLALSITDVILYCVTCLLERRAAAVVPLLVTFFAQILAAVLWSIVASHGPLKHCMRIYGRRSISHHPPIQSWCIYLDSDRR